MAPLPPGTLLQLMYVRERLRDTPPGRFVEIGPGAGHLTNLLLSMNWQGVAYDLEPATIAALEHRFTAEIASGKFKAINGDWLNSENSDRYDLVLSCMVIEHLDDAHALSFVAKAYKSVTEEGRVMSIVPASPAHWGIEDEIAGHYRRYTAESATQLLNSAGFTVTHSAGLTFPISNLLFPLANFLVRRSEASKLNLSMMERTKKSGIRDVPLKTTFPPILGLILNRYTMYPLHLLQKAFRRSKRAMVLYIEARP